MKNEDLLKKLLDFRKERNWEQFHDSKNLSIALSIETNELLEHFLWVDKDEIRLFNQEKILSISEEIADVFIYLSYLSHSLNIDIEDAVIRKLEINSQKYPISKAYGKINKYNKLDEGS